jgi:hypothetical protein
MIGQFAGNLQFDSHNGMLLKNEWMLTMHGDLRKNQTNFSIKVDNRYKIFLLN